MHDNLFKTLPLIGMFMVVIMLFFFGGSSDNSKPSQLEQVIKNASQETSNDGSVASSQESSNNEKSSERKNMNPKTQIPKFQDLIDTNKKYIAEFQTSMGNFKVLLYAKEAPKTVTNFVYLTKRNFYDGLIFHRIIKDFMIQGGDPLGNGTGGPGYKFEDEQSNKPLVKGSLAMANSGPNTNGSQFFIVTAPSTPWLDGKHTNFGEVIEGLEVVQKISEVKTGKIDKPLDDVVINKISIIEE